MCEPNICMSFHYISKIVYEVTFIFMENLDLKFKI